MMLAQVQDQVAARHLAVERRVIVEAVIPIDLEAEKALIELVGLGEVEDAQDRDDAHELNGHRCPSFGPEDYSGLSAAIRDESRDPASKRPGLRGADERSRPLASTRSDLPQHAVTQERGVALTLVGKADKLLREELFFASGFVGDVENLADVFERH